MAKVATFFLPTLPTAQAAVKHDASDQPTKEKFFERQPDKEQDKRQPKLRHAFVSRPAEVFFDIKEVAALGPLP